jgi:splicing factor 1
MPLTNQLLKLVPNADAVPLEVMSNRKLLVICDPISNRVAELNPDGTKKRKKRNRWGDAQENKAAGLMGLPTAIMANMTNEQLEAYTLHLRIEEISQKLRINDVVPADGDRSPSPPPQYDNFGRRTNTRESRYRKRLEDERHKLVERAMKSIPNYHPPSDYRRPTKTQEKVYVPVNDYPEINFSMIANPRFLTSHISYLYSLYELFPYQGFVRIILSLTHPLYLT